MGFQEQGVSLPRKKKMGRPPIKIDWDEFDGLCALQCTLQEIAFALKCSPDTVEKACAREHGKTFTALFTEKRQAGFTSLRSAQFKKAIDERDSRMLIFLDEKYLGGIPVKLEDDRPEIFIRPEGMRSLKGHDDEEK